MGSRLQQPVSIASNIFATLPCPRHLARVFLCRALPCVKLAAARALWRMTRDPLAVARDLACLPRGARSAGRGARSAGRGLPPAMRCPCPLACDPLAVARLPPCPRSAIRSAIRWPWRACPAPLPAIRRHPLADPLADPASSAGRSGVIRWPIRRHPMPDPMPAIRSGALQDTRPACQGPLWQLRLNGP
jgi:hypothetical protein